MRSVAVVAIFVGIATCSAGCGLIGSSVITYQSYGGTAIVSANGRTITVGEFGSSCPTKVKAVARKSATRVALFLQFQPPVTILPAWMRRW
jgi:hypothetical protein